MNEDKLDALPTLCPMCQVEIEYTSGAPRALCHECGTVYFLKMKDIKSFYPTKDNPLQEMVISYDGNIEQWRGQAR